MATLQSIALYGVNNPINASKYPLGHLIRKAAEMQDVIRQHVKEYHQQEQLIRSDTGLTLEGQNRALKKIAGELMEKLKPIQTEILSRLNSHRKDLAASIDSAINKEPSLVEVLREQEIRSDLKQLSDADRLHAFQGALQSGDAATLKAFFNATPIRPLVHDRVLQEGKRLWIQQSNPAAAAELAEFETATTALTENYDDAVSGISQSAGIEDNSMRARLERMNPPQS